MNQTTPIDCKPFLKWAGGKSRLLKELIPRLPKYYEHYFEAFVGGGALFFSLQPSQGTMIDINPELINVYQVIQNQVKPLISDLKKHHHNKNYFYQIRQVDRTPDYHGWTDIQKASRFIYLNKTCYNGLYRVNSKGQFNVPFGCYKNPKIVDEENLKRCHQVLQETTILAGSFLLSEKLAHPHDFIYFDPPYAPVSTTANFTSYSKDGFDLTMQVELRDLCHRLHQQGVNFMVSNSSAPSILELYKDYKIDFIYAPRAINSQGDKRGKVKEVIITNY